MIVLFMIIGGSDVTYSSGEEKIEVIPVMINKVYSPGKVFSGQSHLD